MVYRLLPYLAFFSALVFVDVTRIWHCSFLSHFWPPAWLFWRSSLNLEGGWERTSLFTLFHYYNVNFNYQRICPLSVKSLKRLATFEEFCEWLKFVSRGKKLMYDKQFHKRFKPPVKDSYWTFLDSWDLFHVLNQFMAYLFFVYPLFCVAPVFFPLLSLPICSFLL